MITQPASLPMLLEIVRGAAEDGLILQLQGGCTKIGWLLDRNPPIDVALDMSGLAAIIAHDHGDMTATVQAGIPLAHVQAAVAERGQRLAIDPPLGPGRQATVGGVFATDDAGPGRLGYGSLRELCIGASFVLADGTVGKSGSKVIKNVAGYDLCKLLCGSRGTLAIVGQLTVRLHPIPAAEATVRADVTFSAAARAARKLTAELDPDGLTFHGLDVHAGRLWVRFTGASGFVTEQSRVTQRRLHDLGATQIDVIDGIDSRNAWTEASEARMAKSGETTVAVTVPGARFEDFARGLTEWADGIDARLRYVADPGLGAALIMIAGPPPEPSDLDALLEGHNPAPEASAFEAIVEDHRFAIAEAKRHAALAGGIRRAAIAHGGHARLRDRVPHVVRHIDPFGPLPSSVPLMARVKAALDPDGRLAPGRYLTNP